MVTVQGENKASGLDFSSSGSYNIAPASCHRETDSIEQHQFSLIGGLKGDIKSHRFPIVVRGGFWGRGVLGCRGRKLGSETRSKNRKKKKKKKMTGGIEHLLGLIKVKVLRGTNLAVRDAASASSDPYVVVRMGYHKLKTHVVKKNLNPEWNEELTLSVTEPIHPIKVEVYDKDTFSLDDPMGNAEINIEPLVEAVRMGMDKESLPDGTIIKKITPCRQNCFVEESPIYWSKGRIVQDVVLRLKNVESGELEMQLQWVDIPNARSF